MISYSYSYVKDSTSSSAVDTKDIQQQSLQIYNSHLCSKWNGGQKYIVPYVANACIVAAVVIKRNFY